MPNLVLGVGVFSLLPKAVVPIESGRRTRVWAYIGCVSPQMLVLVVLNVAALVALFEGLFGHNFGARVWGA